MFVSSLYKCVFIVIAKSAVRRSSMINEKHFRSCRIYYKIFVLYVCEYSLTVSYFSKKYLWLHNIFVLIFIDLQGTDTFKYFFIFLRF